MAAVQISPEELSSFHAAHFSTISAGHFAHHFLGPVKEEYAEEEYYEEEYEEDDGLGWYEDGVKRTLTDEQIQIFRHSEIEALLRERRHIAENGRKETPTPTVQPTVDPTVDDGEFEDGELEESSINTPSSHVNTNNEAKKKKKKNKKKKNQNNGGQKSFYKQSVKPDLRKRTWDVVETGLGNLDYDEVESVGASGSSRPAQRRKISYDDD
ncbi:hypothetical protein BGZ60DRAFT_428137 [Tricladium varicosporioides]|nr:hypothetical protein BGZ60DRAFT_428137 [Hymenoscyphus varicosporioides]